MNAVTDLADRMLANLPATDEPPRFFPVTWAATAKPGLHAALLDQPYADIVPKEGEDLRERTNAVGDEYGESYWGPVEPMLFDPAWQTIIVAEKWGPYSHGSAGWKAVGVRWINPNGQVKLSTTNLDAPDFVDAVVGPLGGFGLTRENWMSHYAETGYEGHGFQGAPDPEGTFIQLCTDYQEEPNA